MMKKKVTKKTGDPTNELGISTSLLIYLKGSRHVQVLIKGA